MDWGDCRRGNSLSHRTFLDGTAEAEVCCTDDCPREQCASNRQLGKEIEYLLSTPSFAGYIIRTDSADGHVCQHCWEGRHSQSPSRNFISILYGEDFRSLTFPCKSIQCTTLPSTPSQNWIPKHINSRLQRTTKQSVQLH